MISKKTQSSKTRYQLLRFSYTLTGCKSVSIGRDLVTMTSCGCITSGTNHISVERSVNTCSTEAIYRGNLDCLDATGEFRNFLLFNTQFVEK